ncbi:uncharacterized protein TNCV_2556701 [Trichonephila clavipes]|nr:uncharacterized protein TNCV_2556701 [Trichonephila clavipes]
MMSNKRQNWEKLSVVGEKYRDLYAWEEEEALCKTVDRALLVKQFYKNKRNAAAVHEIRRRKNLLRGPMSAKRLRAMVKRFEETGKLEVQPERGHKRVTPVLVKGAKPLLMHIHRHQSLGAVVHVQFLERQVILTAPFEKYLENIMLYFTYIIHQTHELLDRDKPQRFSFEVNFFNITVDLPSMAMWSNEAHFYLNGTVNTQNCRIWAKKNLGIHSEFPLQSPYVIVWCEFMAAFILGLFLFEEFGTN